MRISRRSSSIPGKSRRRWPWAATELLLQGGLHPRLDITFYENLFRELKRRYPSLRLHALGAPEVAHIARISSLDDETVLRRLMDAGLDSLPGAGAEILDNGVRRRISPGKPDADRWIEVMHTAHRLGLPTSATMMYGHVETPRQRVEHLLRIRDLQARCPEGNPGFLAFIPWIFRSTGTELEREGVVSDFSPLEYLRIIALSRIVLYNIPNIQASWLTVGKATAQMALHGGANDMGSIMIEENVGVFGWSVECIRCRRHTAGYPRGGIRTCVCATSSIGSGIVAEQGTGCTVAPSARHAERADLSFFSSFCFLSHSLCAGFRTSL